MKLERVYVGHSDDWTGLSPWEGGFDVKWVYNTDELHLYEVYVVDASFFDNDTRPPPELIPVVTEQEAQQQDLDAMYYFRMVDMRTAEADPFNCQLFVVRE